MSLSRKCFVLSFLMFSIALHAQEKEAEAPKNPAVLDFEADTIEGENKSPDLLVLMADKKLDLDSFVFLRNDFNDFLSRDEKKKNYLIRRQSGAGKK